MYYNNIVPAIIIIIYQLPINIKLKFVSQNDILI